MLFRDIARAFLAFGAMVMLSAAAVASPPGTYQVTLYLYETPNDVESPLLYAFSLTLTPADEAGNAIGWLIEEAALIRPDAGGGDPHVFIDTDPNVASGDGLWWVQHADPNAPTIEEFDYTPLVTGATVPLDSSDPDLEYEFEGHGPVQGGQGTSQPMLAAVSYVIIQSGEEEPEEEGDNEPMPIDPDTPPNL